MLPKVNLSERVEINTAERHVVRGGSFEVAHFTVACRRQLEARHVFRRNFTRLM